MRLLHKMTAIGGEWFDGD